MTPIDFAEANAFVTTFHRHHKPMVGCKFCVAVSSKIIRVHYCGDGGQTCSPAFKDFDDRSLAARFAKYWRAEKGHTCKHRGVRIERTFSKVRGVAIVGRPVARNSDNGWTLEVNRVCTDGARNACSMLYGAAWRAAKALGYRRLVTYTLPAEGGASLRAAGWKLIGERGGGNWNVPSRPRIDTAEVLRGQKLLWEAA